MCHRLVYLTVTWPINKTSVLGVTKGELHLQVFVRDMETPQIFMSNQNLFCDPILAKIFYYISLLVLVLLFSLGWYINHSSV